MKKYLVVAACLIVVVGIAFGQSFLASKTKFVDIVAEARMAFGINPTRSYIDVNDVETLYKIGLIDKRQAASLYGELTGGSRITTATELINVKYFGDSSAAQLCLIFNLDTTGWTATTDK